MAFDTHAAQALAALDAALAKQPHADGHLFSEAVQHMAACRDALIEGLPDRRPALDTANAVLSMLLAGHFPLGSVPWPEIKTARGWLATLAERGPTDAPGA